MLVDLLLSRSIHVQSHTGFGIFQFISFCLLLLKPVDENFQQLCKHLSLCLFSAFLDINRNINLCGMVYDAFLLINLISLFSFRLLSALKSAIFDIAEHLLRLLHDISFTHLWDLNIKIFLVSICRDSYLLLSLYKCLLSIYHHLKCDLSYYIMCFLCCVFPCNFSGIAILQSAVIWKNNESKIALIQF